MNKNCNKCGESKEINKENFRSCKYSSGKLYFKSACRLCEKNYATNYNKSYKKTEEQKNNFIEYKKKWREDRKELENKKYRLKFRNDFAFRLRKNVSRAINHALKKQNSKKNNNSISEYLDYSIDELKIHLENKFDSNMNWKNYGIYWELDHIIPQSCLTYKSMSENNFQICWALKNLRPLEAHVNRKDGSTRIRHFIYNNLLNEVS